MASPINQPIPYPDEDKFAETMTALTEMRPQHTELSGIAIVRYDNDLSVWSANYTTTSTAFPIPSIQNITRAKASFQRRCPTNAAVTTCAVVVVNVNNIITHKWQVAYKVIAPQWPPPEEDIDTIIQHLERLKSIKNMTNNRESPTREPNTHHKFEKPPTNTQPNQPKGAISKLIKTIKRLKWIDCLTKHTSDIHQLEALEGMRATQMTEVTGITTTQEALQHKLNQHRLKLQIETYESKNKLRRLQLADQLLSDKLQDSKTPKSATVSNIVTGGTVNQYVYKTTQQNKQPAQRFPPKPVKFVNPHREFSCQCTDTTFCLYHHKRLNCYKCSDDKPCRDHLEMRYLDQQLD